MRTNDEDLLDIISHDIIPISYCPIPQSARNLSWKERYDNIHVSLHKRIPLIFDPVKLVIEQLYEWTSNIHTSIPNSTLEVMHDDVRKIYVGLHKSLWETMGVPVVIFQQDAVVPYIVIGKNLVKGISKAFMKSVGCIYVERPSKDITNQDFESAMEIKKKIVLGLQRGDDILIFPMDGRTKTGYFDSFYSTPFDAALEYAKNAPIYIIPFDVDYEYLNDMSRMIRSIQKNKSYTLRIWQIPEWWKDLGNIYVNFAEPIEVTKTTNRKKLNFYALEKAKACTKILDVNIFSAAALMARRTSELPQTIDSVIEKLAQKHLDKFRGFTDKQDIIDKFDRSLVNEIGIEQRPNDIKDRFKFSLNWPLRAYKIHSRYISQYLSTDISNDSQ